MSRDREPARPSSRSARRAPAWPSLEEQLRNVRPGSALESLIRDNQDFSLLDPSEADDGVPFPPWLRVYVRKGHPEVKFSGPPVGYPLLLERVLAYMMRNQDAPTGRGSIPLLQSGAQTQQAPHEAR
jgi:hypothetical protein